MRPAVQSLFAMMAAVAYAQPLQLERAERSEVLGGGAEVRLHGDVVVLHGDTRLYSGRATWWRLEGWIALEDSLRVEHPAGRLKARAGRFDQRSQMADAWGNAVLVDSSGEVRLYAGRLRSLRRERSTLAWETPRFERIRGARGDTLVLEGDELRWDEGPRVALASGRVQLRVGGLLGTADRAELNESRRRVRLWGDPVLDLGGRRLRGDSMEVHLTDDLQGLRFLRSMGSAQGESTPDDESSRHTRLMGDTLEANVRGDSVDTLHARGTAVGIVWNAFDTLQADTLSGDRLAFAFVQDGLGSAIADGSARSHVHDRGEGARRAAVHRVRGARIEARFADGRIRRIRVTESVEGGWHER